VTRSIAVTFVIETDDPRLAPENVDLSSDVGRHLAREAAMDNLYRPSRVVAVMNQTEAEVMLAAMEHVRRIAARGLCACGLPMHYSDPAAYEAVQRQVDLHGPNINVTLGGRTWSVPRHYIALHGLKGADVAGLGFPEVT
jgi:hypothetical protein